jgi:DNA-binding response OmpR family regulator
MDRVLLVIDDIQFNRQIEMALRKIGFEVESTNNEFNLNQTLLSFNPDYIVIKGQGARLNSLNVARKLKESNNQNNKVILILGEKVEVSAEDIFKIRADVILNEPVSTLRLVIYLISLSGLEIEFVKEKLLKYAITDPQFRNGEQQLLKNAGVTIDSEIELLSNLTGPVKLDDPKNFKIISNKTDEKSDLKFFQGENKVKGTVKVFPAAQKQRSTLIIPSKGDVANAENPEQQQISEENKLQLQEEINQQKSELPLRIDSYNHSSKNTELDTNIGLKKRETKKEFKQLHEDLLTKKKTDPKSEKLLDVERIKFTKALFKKK